MEAGRCPHELTVLPVAASSWGVEASGEELPEGFARVTAGQMEVKRWHPRAEPPADLDEAQSAGGGLHASDTGLEQDPPEGIQQPGGGGKEQPAELVGPGGMAAAAVGKAGVCTN